MVLCRMKPRTTHTPSVSMRSVLLLVCKRLMIGNSNKTGTVAFLESSSESGVVVEVPPFAPLNAGRYIHLKILLQLTTENGFAS